MPYKRYGRRGGRKPATRTGRKTVRTARLVNGKSPFTAMEQVYKAGGNALPYIIRGYKQIRSLINTEPKFKLTTQLTQSVDSTNGVVYPLNLIAQGNDEQERNGNRILAKDLYLKLLLTQNASATISIMRVIVVVDKENRGATIAFSDVLEAVSMMSHKNVDNTKRFTTLFDKVFNFSSNATRSITMSKFMKLPFHIDYGGTDATISSVKENAIFLLAISNEATNQPTITMNSKLTFYDN